jgi:hypothetical protein
MLRGVRAWLALTVLALPAWGAALAQTASPVDVDIRARSVIADCARHIDYAVAGLEEVEKRCPDLASALQAAGLRPLIIASSRAQFDRQSLALLTTLLHPALGAGPDVSKLEPILRGLRPPVSPSRSWWERLWDWIVKHLTGREQQPTDSWWVELVRQAIAARWLWITLVVCVLTALVAVVAGVVVREVRAGRAGRAAPASSPAAPFGPADSHLALLRQAPLGQRPARLFAMLIARLVSAGRLPADRSLTHREVVRRARLEDPDQRRYIESLARLSEQQLYSGAKSLPDGIEEVLARGEDLYTIGWSRPAVTE